MILFLLLLQDGVTARVPLHEFNFRSDFLQADHIISSEQGSNYNDNDNIITYYNTGMLQFFLVKLG